MEGTKRGGGGGGGGGGAAAAMAYQGGITEMGKRCSLALAALAVRPWAQWRVLRRCLSAL